MDAVHYLVKPVHMDSLLELLRRFFRRSGIPVRMLELKWGSKSLCVPMHRITRIQSSNKGVDVYLQGLAGRSGRMFLSQRLKKCWMKNTFCGFREGFWYR